MYICRVSRLFILLVLPLFISCEQTSVEYIWLKPDAAEGKDALIKNDPTHLISSTSTVFKAEAQYDDQLQQQLISRSLIEFDLSSLPRNAKVLHAELRLFNGERSDLQANLNALNSNECVLQRITESWEESDINWDNQPETSTVNQVIINPSSSEYQDVNIDVTNLLIDLQRIENFGIMLKLRDETGTKRKVFGSSDAFHSEFHPELLVEFEIKRAILAN